GLFAFAGVLRIGEGQLLHARGAPEGLAAISPDREVFFRPSLKLWLMFLYFICAIQSLQMCFAVTLIPVNFGRWQSPEKAILTPFIWRLAVVTQGR
ncbi:hypothetical protein KRX52_19635, partial [Pseudomonas sp. MAP12]